MDRKNMALESNRSEFFILTATSELYDCGQVASTLWGSMSSSVKWGIIILKRVIVRSK